MSRLWRVSGIASTIVLGLLVTWKLVTELIEPHFLLWLYPRAPYVEAPTTGGTKVRLYSDTRPYTGKIARLQKGLVWVRDGRLFVEEGYGFGCPIVEFDGMAYLSRHAKVDVSTQGEVTRLVKRYQIDTVDTPIRLLRRKYRTVSPLGIVEYRYDVYMDGTIDVEVDLSGLTVDWTRAYLMNEQGARHFTDYADSAGRHLASQEIGIWEASTEFISRACFDSKDGLLEFCVEPEPPAVVYFGRERYSQYNWRGIYTLSWSGVDIEVAAPLSVYRYRIALEAR